MEVVFAETGRQELTVAMLYGQEQAEGDWLLSIEAYEPNYPEQFDLQVFVTTTEGVDPAVAVAAIEREAGGYWRPGPRQDEYPAERMAIVDQLLGLVYALLGLAILIASSSVSGTPWRSRYWSAPGNWGCCGRSA